VTNRRDVLQSALAVTTLPIAGALQSLSGANHLRPLDVVYDTSFAPSIAFANELSRHGSTPYSFSGDVTDLWYHTLDAKWRAAPVALAGLTAHGPLFCLERLGWEYGLRLTFRSEHYGETLDSLRHSLDGPNTHAQELDSWVAAGAAWPREVASLLARDPQTLSQPLSALRVGAVRSATAGDDSYSRYRFVSWVLSPMRR
jgi:hypothetical protein